MTDLYYLSQADGVGEWRMKEAKDLSDLVQNRITYLQVPSARPTSQRTLTHSPIHLHAHIDASHTCRISKRGRAFTRASFTLNGPHLHRPSLLASVSPEGG